MTHNPHLSLIQNQYLQKTLRFYPDSLISTTSPQSIASTFPPSAPLSFLYPTYPPLFLLAHLLYLLHLPHLSAYCICLLSTSASIISIHTYLKFICLIISYLQNNHKNNHSKIWSVQKKVVTLHRISEKRPKLNV